MWRKATSVLVLLVALTAASCASSKSGSGTGVRILEGVVVDREQEAPSKVGASFQGSAGNYYLVFEAKDGDATARYRYQVTYQQWFRFPEGSHVRITINNNFLQDIQPNEQ